MELDGTSVMRCGATDKRFDIENSTVEAFAISDTARTLLRFQIPAAGGGQTVLQLAIRAEAFAASTAIAVKLALGK